MGTLVGIGIFVVFIVGIWYSYRLFVRGNMPEEEVAALLPPGFKPDLFHRKGDTYVGYEKQSNRLVLVDWPHANVLAPEEVRSLEPVHESILGLTHHWLAIDVPDPKFSRYRIWFQFRRANCDAWRSRLAEICKK